MTKTEELLKVLDLPEDSPEQYGWLLGTIREHEACCPADLAFRLRDEFESVLQHVDFEIGRYHVFAHCNNKTYKWTEKNCNLADLWFIEWGQPIHWIISSLIAKEIAKAEKP